MIYLSRTGGRPADFWSLSAWEFSAICSAAAAAAAPSPADAPMTRDELSALMEVS